MKKGMIVYVTQGKNEMREDQVRNLAEVRRDLKAQSLRLALTEDDVAEAWWRLVSAGMHQVFCIGGRYHPQEERLEVHGRPFRLAG